MKAKRLLFLTLMALCATPAWAYNFSAVAPSGQTLYYNIVDGNAEVTSQNSSYPCYYTYPTGSLVIPNSVVYGGVSYTVTSIGNFAFYNCNSLTSVTIPDGVTSIGGSAFSDCYGLTSITIPDGVTSIGEGAFWNCSGLTSVTIPDGVTSIGIYAFSDCYGLTSITIPDGVTSIGIYAFSDCYGLTSITIPDGVTSIGEGAFCNCSGLTSVTIPDGVTSIEQSTFYGCSGLTSVTIPDGVTTIGFEAFYGCSGLTSVTIGSGVTSIGECAFSGCSGLTSITIPDGVTSIGEFAFSNCSSLTSVTIPDGVTSIDYATFRDCSGLTSVTIPDGVTTIGYEAFYNCRGLTSVTIPDGVTSIGECAFYGCSGLDTVFMRPETAPSLGSDCFYNNATGRVFMIPCGSYDSYYRTNYWNYLREPVVDLSISVASSNPYFGSASVVPIRGNNVHCDSTTIVYATADEHCVFDHWSNGNTANPDTLHLTSDSAVTAVFIPNQYTVTGVSSDNIKGTVYGSATVYYLDTVTLTATANYGYHYTGWNDNNTDNPRLVVVTDNITLTALFDYNQFSLTVQPDTYIHGNCTGSGNYNYLSERTIRANANYGYHFTQWTVGDTNNPRVITLTQDTTFTALFAKNQYTLTVSSNDTTLGSVVGSGTYEYLDTVSISATAIIEHYHFVRWDDGNTQNPRNIIMTNDISRSAIFAIDMHSVTVQSANITHGTCSGSGQYQYGTAATVEALPYSGYQFSHWSDGSTYNPYTFAVVNDVQLTAHFYAVGTPYQDTLTVYDTVYMSVYVHDTTYIDVYDTTYIDVHDTTIIHDTIYIHDTIVVGLDEVDAIDAKIFTSHGQIVVEGTEGNQVLLYGVNGRLLATKQDEYSPLYFDVPASGTYLIKIGSHPARRVVVIK